MSRRKGSFTGKAGPIEQQEVQLMDVKRVQLAGTILDDPIFDISLFHNDIRNVRLWIEGRVGSGPRL